MTRRPDLASHLARLGDQAPASPSLVEAAYSLAGHVAQAVRTLLRQDTTAAGDDIHVAPMSGDWLVQYQVEQEKRQPDI